MNIMQRGALEANAENASVSTRDLLLAAQKGYQTRDALIAELAQTLQSVRPIVSRARKVRIDAVLAKVPK